jgi:hypothetical protein
MIHHILKDTSCHLAGFKVCFTEHWAVRCSIRKEGWGSVVRGVRTPGLCPKQQVQIPEAEAELEERVSLQ